MHNDTPTPETKYGDFHNTNISGTLHILFYKLEDGATEHTTSLKSAPCTRIHVIEFNRPTRDEPSQKSFGMVARDPWVVSPSSFLSSLKKKG